MAKKWKTLITTDNAVESFEILYAKYRFLEAGFHPVIVASKKKTLNSVIHDSCPVWNTYIEKRGYLIDVDKAIADIKAKDFDARLSTGERAPEFLRHNSKLIKQFNKKWKWLFTICHSIQVFLAAGLGANRRMTCYKNVHFEVAQARGPTGQSTQRRGWKLGQRPTPGKPCGFLPRHLRPAQTQGA
ncbi:MAG: putative cysteine protease YraA [Verrucomicrobia subdivision 3 bacterium]|nr:putative cysteine protease YraA [Limisphaerales bacterium]MCS1413851.1 putative cysteine protease YraA [Limisphaerales bacterium]